MGTEQIALFWVSTSAMVFLLGFQSRSVNSGRIVSAACTSFLIAFMQMITIRSIATGDPRLILAVTGSAGPVGIVLSMLFARFVFRKPDDLGTEQYVEGAEDD